VPDRPEFDDFQRKLQELRERLPIEDDQVDVQALTLDGISDLMRDDAGYYFLMAAAGLNRTGLKRGVASPEARIAPKKLRRALVVRQRLPVRISFQQVCDTALTLRGADLGRKTRGRVEQLFRDRLRAEGIPILMSPPVRQVPGLLIGKRKPDGVYPNPADDLPPRIYLEIKNVRRVADDIQKRLYEIAEASLEMKLLYGRLSLRGFDIASPNAVVGAAPKLRKRIRAQITKARPTVVVLFLCSREEAERYRDAAEAFVDRVFFQEEIDECLAFLRKTAEADASV